MINSIPRSKIDEDLYLVLKTIFHYERILADRFGLEFNEIYVLQYLRRNAVARVTDLSLELQLPMFTVSRVMDKLAKAGYVSKSKDTADRRNVYLKLEPAGEELLVKIENASYANISSNILDLSQQELNQLLHIAEKLHVVLGVTDHVVK